MTKAERLIESAVLHPFRVMDKNCPSDFEMEDLPDCMFRECGVVNKAECVLCWCAEDKTWQGMPVPVKERKMDEEKLKWIAEYFGADHQLMKLAEECGELVQAIIKFEQGAGGIGAVMDEEEDVRILLDQVALLYGRKYETRTAKIDRTIKKIQDMIEGANYNGTL